MKGFDGIEKVQAEFAKQTDLDNALRYMAGDARWCHDYYQHYTTLDRVIDKIKGDWWMTRADSVRLNDLQESRKFGVRDLYSKTYQISFCHGKAEGAAMWGLYANNNPFAIRITIPADKMKLWIDSIFVDESMSVDDKKEKCALTNLPNCEKLRIVDIRDVIYAPATLCDKNADKYTQERYDKICWEGQFAKEMKDFSKQRFNRMSSAILKDYEWRHERESRIIVGYDETASCKKSAIKLKVPEYVIADMRFTFSPWLKDEYFVYIEKMIRTIYDIRGIKFDGRSVQRFKRSNLQNALNF